MRQLLAAIAVTAFTTLVSASPVYHPLGPNLTFGDVAHGQSIMSGINNPAAGATAIRDEGDSSQFSVWSGFGVGYEIGEFDNLYNEIDAYADAFDTGKLITAGSINQEVDELNTILSQIEKEGYAKAFSTFQMPIVPIIISSDLLGGSLVFDAYVSATSNANLLYQPVAVSDVTVNGSTYTVDINNDTTLLLKAAAIQELSLGYSRLIFSTPAGSLYAGLRGKYLKVGLVQANERLGTVTSSEQAFDNIDKNDINYGTNFGVDIGLLLTSKHYRLGATFTNVNEPSYEYNAIDLTGYTPSGDVYQRLVAKTTYTMEAQLKLEAALFSQNKHWVLGLGVDANPVADGVGDDYQWATFSAAYVADSWILPGVRMGLRQNLAGSELSFATGGLTLFNLLNLDIAYGLEKVEVDGKSQPRSAMINLGLELTF